MIDYMDGDSYNCMHILQSIVFNDNIIIRSDSLHLNVINIITHVIIILKIFQIP